MRDRAIFSRGNVSFIKALESRNLRSVGFLQLLRRFIIPRAVHFHSISPRYLSSLIVSCFGIHLPSAWKPILCPGFRVSLLTFNEEERHLSRRRRRNASRRSKGYGSSVEEEVGRRSPIPSFMIHSSSNSFLSGHKSGGGYIFFPDH